MKEKKIKFEELAVSRVNKAIKLLRLISNLANKSHYNYSDTDAEKIVNALNQEIKNDSNLVPHIINCIKSNCTLGEICNTMKNNYGEHN